MCIYRILFYTFPNKQLAVLQLGNKHFLDRWICLTNLNLPSLIFPFLPFLSVSWLSEWVVSLSFLCIFIWRSEANPPLLIVPLRGSHAGEPERVSPQPAQPMSVEAVLHEPRIQPVERVVTAELEFTFVVERRSSWPSGGEETGDSRARKACVLSPRWVFLLCPLPLTTLLLPDFVLRFRLIGLVGLLDLTMIHVLWFL